jgi:hypothetical protein
VVEDDVVDGSADGDLPLVVHVHVHRDADGRIVANAEEEGGTVATRASRRHGGPAPRPALTGQLFDWKGHYDLVAKRHADAGLSPPTLWEALRATLQGRDPSGAKRPRRG